MILRAYQQDILDQLLASSGNDLVQLDTGAGKTPIEAALAEQYPHVMLLAHRNTLICQMSEKLAAFGLEHDTISTEHTRRRCMLAHRRHGRTFIVRGHASRLAVSVDSLLAHHRRGRLRIDHDAPWLIVVDEAHHVLPDNKWGRLRELFPSARIVGFTATPGRMDGESLHVSKGGLFERLVQAKGLRTNSVAALISAGYLSDFTVFSPDNIFHSMERNELGIGGDPVGFYAERFRGRPAIMFCPSIKNSQEFAEQFRDAGIPAAHIGSDLSSVGAARVLDAFSSGRVDVLTNVDMVSEGFDMPDVEVLIMCRKTMSFIAYRQWCGRALRPDPGKRLAYIVDHVGNVEEHGMPDDPVEWDLENPPRGTGTLRHIPCHACGKWYPLRKRHCPDCGAENKLLTRQVIGGHYVNIVQRLDSRMLERERRSVEREAFDERWQREVIWPAHTLPGTINQMISRMRKWFVEELRAGGVAVADINLFLHSPASDAQDFWITNFTIKDMVPGSMKPRKVFKKWQSQSSTETPATTAALRILS